MLRAVYVRCTDGHTNFYLLTGLACMHLARRKSSLLADLQGAMKKKKALQGQHSPALRSDTEAHHLSGRAADGLS